MDQCGDGVHNNTFEICEYSITPGIPFTSSGTYYDGNSDSDYPTEEDDLTNANATVMWVTGYLHDLYSDTSICTDIEDADCVGYF